VKVKIQLNMEPVWEHNTSTLYDNYLEESFRVLTVARLEYKVRGGQVPRCHAYFEAQLRVMSVNQEYRWRNVT
jgi:hypothetical protein